MFLTLALALVRNILFYITQGQKYKYVVCFSIIGFGVSLFVLHILLGTSQFTSIGRDFCLVLQGVNTACICILYDVGGIINETAKIIYNSFTYDILYWKISCSFYLNSLSDLHVQPPLLSYTVAIHVPCFFSGDDLQKECPR